MAHKKTGNRQPAPAMTTTRWVGLFLAIALFFLPLIVTFPGLSQAGHRVFGVFLAAVVLWITEAIPLHATATVIILLEVLLISDKSPWTIGGSYAAPAYSVFFATLAAPVLMLFLGGFFLAHGAAKYDLDRNLARVMLRPFGTQPKWILLGLISITAVFSMFMSNTATTATMMAVVLPIVAQLPPGDRLRTALALSIPIAANIGGIGTPIGTPPNAIALGALSQAGVHVGFLQWMIMALPLVIVLLPVAWLLLCTLFPSQSDRVELKIDSAFNKSRPAILFYITFAVTILLWLTDKLHGLGANIVGFLPVVVLLSTRVFTAKDLQSIQWHVLWLVAGGIALGKGVAASGLDAWLIAQVRWDALPSVLIVALLSLTAWVFSNVISHSATANLVVPLAMTLSMSEGIGINPMVIAVFVAVSCSLGMSLAISTPPNAIAMSTGAVKTKDLALVGTIVGLVGWGTFVLGAEWFWRLTGVMP